MNHHTVAGKGQSNSPPQIKNRAISLRRLWALCYKESLQISRDPSSILIVFFIPVLLLFIFGYGINLDSSRLKIGIVMEEPSYEANAFINSFAASPFIDLSVAYYRQPLIDALQAGQIRGLVILQSDFARKLNQPGQIAPILVITDGSEPNTANFVQGYSQRIWQIWQQQLAEDEGISSPSLIDIEPRYWFNPAVISHHFIIPGAITIVMTVIGAILTSLVVAREWERGTMEALLSTSISRAELLLSKLLPYYVLGMTVMVFCMVVTVFVMHVPYHGSLIILFIVSSLFLASTLGMGLLISTLMRNQFNAAMVALNVAFLPTVTLSGFIFVIESMPTFIQAVTYLIPARYFVNTLQSLFLVGNVVPILMGNILFLIFSATLFLGLTAIKTRRRLE